MRVNGINCFRANSFINSQKQNSQSISVSDLQNDRFEKLENSKTQSKQGISFGANIIFAELGPEVELLLKQRMGTKGLEEATAIINRIANILKPIDEGGIMDIGNYSDIEKEMRETRTLPTDALRLDLEAKYIKGKELLDLSKYGFSPSFEKDFSVSKIVRFSGEIKGGDYDGMPYDIDIRETFHGLAAPLKEIEKWVIKFASDFKSAKEIPEFLANYPKAFNSGKNLVFEPLKDIPDKFIFQIKETVDELAKGFPEFAKANKVKLAVSFEVKENNLFLKIGRKFDKSTKALIEKYIANPDKIYSEEILMGPAGSKTGEGVLTSTSQMIEFLSDFDKTMKEKCIGNPTEFFNSTKQLAYTEGSKINLLMKPDQSAVKLHEEISAISEQRKSLNNITLPEIPYSIEIFDGKKALEPNAIEILIGRGIQQCIEFKTKMEKIRGQVQPVTVISGIFSGKPI